MVFPLSANGAKGAKLDSGTFGCFRITIVMLTPMFNNPIVVLQN